MGFPRQEYWSGLPFPSPGHLPHPETEPALNSPALAGYSNKETVAQDKHKGHRGEVGSNSSVRIADQSKRKKKSQRSYSRYKPHP